MEPAQLKEKEILKHIDLSQYPYIEKTTAFLKGDPTLPEMEDHYKTLQKETVGKSNIVEINQCLRLVIAAIKFQRLKSRDSLRRGKITKG